MEQEKREIAAEFDDKAFEVAKFIQQLTKIQEDWLEGLCKKAKEKGLVKGFEEEDRWPFPSELEDWLHDYCYNGKLNQSFSEYCDSVMG
jgi:hypothetical protein